MSSTKELSIKYLCPNCKSESIDYQENISLPVKCQNCGFETTDEHLTEFNQSVIHPKESEEIENASEKILKNINDSLK